ncbi:MAG: rhodanese-like domain-containing protein [Candidatus Baltobacteraceae bacterium]
MHVLKFVADGVSDRSYMIVDAAGGVAAVVDAQRDVWTYLDEAERLGVRITHAFDTHVHNDFISGSRSLAEVAGTTVVQAQGAGFEYPVHQVCDGDRIELGHFVVRALHTPGHTPHHTSWVVEERGRPVGVFTGGSLLVETIGRTDLVSPGATEGMARAQRASLLKLLDFPDDTEVFPTHGAGSFCSAGEAPDREITSIGREKRDNAAARIAMFEDEDAFVRHALHGLPGYPAYYAHMAPANRRGQLPPLLALPPLEALDPRKAHELQRRGVALVDARKALDFVAGYPEGARSIPLGDSFAGYVGWMLPFDAEMVFVFQNDEDWRRAQGQLVRIGFDRAEGFVAGGFPAWSAAGLPVDCLQSLDLDELHRRHRAGEIVLLDVRQDAEWRSGHVPGAAHIPIGTLPARLGDVPFGNGVRVATVCASGMRATIAASLLKRIGIDPLVVARGGVEDWAERGWPIQREP